MATVKGDREHLARLRRMRGAAMTREMGKAIYVAADLLSTEAALSITAGAVSGKNHVPSLPGEPPNADTHVLDRSIHTRKAGPLVAQSVADAPYAAALEFSTSRVAERPFMRPAAEKTRPKALKLVQAALKKVLAGGSL